MIYFIQEEQRRAIKIGYTAGDPLDRMADLQTGNPDTLNLIGVTSGTTKKEGKLHDVFSPEHIRGEWFKPSTRLLNHIKRLPKQSGISLKDEVLGQVYKELGKNDRDLTGKLIKFIIGRII